ncbi:MAG: adenosylhomocysteinase [Syntrophotaleaceae bacterium]
MAAAGIPVFGLQGRDPEEYWRYTKAALNHPDGPNLIVDDGGDATLLVHRGVAREIEFEQSG